MVYAGQILSFGSKVEQLRVHSGEGDKCMLEYFQAPSCFQTSFKN
jgi:hypothetical protein